MQGIGETRYRVLRGGCECATSLCISSFCFAILTPCSCLPFQTPSRTDDVKSRIAPRGIPQEIGGFDRSRPTLRHWNITPGSTLRIVDIFRPAFVPTCFDQPRGGGGSRDPAGRRSVVGQMRRRYTRARERTGMAQGAENRLGRNPNFVG